MARPGAAWIREAAWLTEERVVAYARMALLAYLAVGIYGVATLHAGVVAWGGPLGGDYLNFWTAGRAALQGEAASAYDFDAHLAQQAAVIAGVPASYFPWSYPPIFLMPLALLALLPYGASLLAWLVLTGAAYVATLRRLFPHARTALVALAWPGVLDNAQSGQNGFLSAALLGGGMLLLESRPLAAGALLGLLSYKPQVALLVPLALIAGGYWRALMAMALCVLLLCGATVAWFGLETWAAFDASRHATQELLEGAHGLMLGKVSVFSAIRLLGGGVTLAWLVQGVFLAALVALIAWAWRSAGPPLGKGALLAAAIPLTVPWVNVYDLMILAIPGAWVLREGLRGGFRPWERFAVLAAAMLPLFAVPLATCRVPLAPVVELGLLWVIVARLRSLPRGPADGTARS